MKRPWMAFWVAEYLADTTHLTTQQHGAYVLLILRYWATGGIPNDDAHLAQIVRLDLDTWLREKPTVLAFFNDDLTHKRIEQELTKAASISRRRSASAKSRHTKSKQASEVTSKSTSANAEQVHGQSQSHTQEGLLLRRAPPSVGPVSSEALAFADELARLCGVDPLEPPLQWINARPGVWVQRWLSAGFDVGVMRQNARAAIRSKRDGPPRDVRYFDPIFAKAHAPPLPLPPAQLIKTDGDQGGKNLNGGRHGSSPGQRGGGFAAYAIECALAAAGQRSSGS